MSKHTEPVSVILAEHFFLSLFATAPCPLMRVNKKQDATSLRKPFVGFPSKEEMSIKLAQFL